ncbi:hypothetical protein [Alteromonas sp. CYL-A6]|uniref:hypothetical protein n=1 Tax=Alteromonas nitratireducens TaxID=3390813 RepID=UPI0034ADE5B7
MIRSCSLTQWVCHTLLAYGLSRLTAKTLGIPLVSNPFRVELPVALVDVSLFAVCFFIAGAGLAVVAKLRRWHRQ